MNVLFNLFHATSVFLYPPENISELEAFEVLTEYRYAFCQMLRKIYLPELLALNSFMS